MIDKDFGMLRSAVKRNNLGKLKKLIVKGVDLNVCDVAGDTALAMAIALENAFGSAGIASQHEVGQWVEQTSDCLAERTQLVRNVETLTTGPTYTGPAGSSNTLVAAAPITSEHRLTSGTNTAAGHADQTFSFPDLTPGTSIGGQDAEATQSAFFPPRPPSQSTPGFGPMSSEASRSLLLAKSRSHRRWPTVVGVALLVAVAIGTSYLVWKQQRMRWLSGNVPALSAPGAATSPPPGAVLTPPPELPSMKASAETTPVPKPPGSRSEVTGRPATKGGNAHGTEGAAIRSTGEAAVDPCDPPYTLDASGFRHVKAACRLPCGPPQDSLGADYLLAFEQSIKFPPDLSSS